MRDIITTVYKFEELTDKAKERAREWYRNTSFDSLDFTIDDCMETAKLIGIDIDKIYYSGFSSQGDGACFIGSYSYKPGSIATIKKERPNDDKLLKITTALYNLQRVNFYQLTAKTSHRGHYNHSGCMQVECYRQDGKETSNGTDDDLTQILRDFADWIYSSLEDDYDYQMSDGAVDENIINNEYEFTVDGGIV